MVGLMRPMTDIVRTASQFRTEELGGLGLKACHASYLITVCRNPGITQDQLAHAIFINKSNVARQLVILEEDGFVERRSCPSDKRAIQVYPTEKTLSCMPRIREILRSWEEFVAQDLTEEEKDLLQSMLAKMEQRSAQWMDSR